MKNSKILLFLVLLVTGVALNAQATGQTLCTEQVETYIVDDGDASPAGSYTWTLEDAADVDLSSLIVNGTTNEITIDWSSTTLDTYTLPVTFDLTVVENVGGCDGEPRTFTVTLIEGYDAPSITEVTDNICFGDADVTQAFLLTDGTPSTVVGYTISSTNDTFTDIVSTVTLDANGDASIPYPTLTDADSSETFTLTLTSIVDPNNEDCSELDLSDDNITETVTINPIPVTSEIQVVTPPAAP